MGRYVNFSRISMLAIDEVNKVGSAALFKTIPMDRALGSAK
jgi:hypothetical protein